jgi:hypothetical protein
VTTLATILQAGAPTLIVDRINKPRLAGDLDLYTPRWGSSTGTSPDGTEVVLTAPNLPLRASGTWTAVVTAVRTAAGDTPIADGTLVLSAQGADAATLDALPVGAMIAVTTAVPAGWEAVTEAVSGREWLVRGGVAGVSPVSALTTAAHPRTSVGQRPDGSVVLVTMDGGQAGESHGVTADDLAELLVAQGVQTAVNLDGGGSSAALARRPGDVTATLVNNPSGGRERSVADALLVVSAIPTGPLARVVVRPGDVSVIAGQGATFAAYGTDDALNGVPLPPSSVTWSLAGSGATISAAGAVSATSPGGGILMATSGALSGSAVLTVLPDTVAPTPAAPAASLRPATVGSAGDVALTVSWTASTDVGVGVAGYELRRRIGAGPWTTVVLASPLARSTVERVAPRVPVEYQVRAVDRAGNAGPWRSTGAFEVAGASERSASYTGRWQWQTGGSYLGGADRASKAAGATASYTFTANQVAWIAAKGPTRGSARISIDGVEVAAVSLWSATLQIRRVVYTRSWTSVGRHKITIRVAGTTRHPWVDIDGFAIITTAG